MADNENAEAPRCGTVAIVGRPNVGKSTLLNRIIGQKISITSRKPQTTRNRILGVRTRDNVQIVFADTPGWQSQPRGALNLSMNRQVNITLQEMDCVVMMIDARRWTDDDECIAEMLFKSPVPKFLVLNKHDRLKDKEELLLRLQDVGTRWAFSELIPTSAINGDNVDRLLEIISRIMPFRPHVFPDDQITDRTERFLVAEIIREKITRQLGDELPYSIFVTIDAFVDHENRTDIDATIWVDRLGQKGIVIGKSGSRLKLIGTAARHDIEALLARTVMLRTWVKEKSNWTQDLKSLDLFDPTP